MPTFLQVFFLVHHYPWTILVLLHLFLQIYYFERDKNWSFNSWGTRKSNNEWKGVVEFGLQTWSIDLVLVIIERGNLILGVPPPRGALPHPLKSHLLLKRKSMKSWRNFFLLQIFLPQAWVHEMVKRTPWDSTWKGSKINFVNKNFVVLTRNFGKPKNAFTNI